jgi:hypothetical protein
MPTSGVRNAPAKGGDPQHPEEPSFEVRPSDGQGASETSTLLIRASEVLLVFLSSAYKRRLIKTQLPGGGPALRKGVVFLLTHDRLFASTMRSIREVHEFVPGHFVDLNQGVAMQPHLVRDVQVIDAAKWVKVQARSDAPTFRNSVSVKISRSRYQALRGRFGLSRRKRQKRPIADRKQPIPAGGPQGVARVDYKAPMQPTFFSRNGDLIEHFEVEGECVTLAAGVVARWAQVSLCSGGGAWCLLVGEAGAAEVNGVPVAPGVAVLDHRDQIETRGGRTLFLSLEQRARVVPFPGAAAVACARCRLEITPGAPATRCPRCGVYAHESQESLCFSYDPKCAACGSTAALDGALEWNAGEAL